MRASLDLKSTEVQSLCSVNPFIKQKELIVIREENIGFDAMWSLVDTRSALIGHINLIYDKIYIVNKKRVVQTRFLCLPSTVT